MGGFGTTEHTIFLRLGVVEDFQNARDGALDSGSIELLALFVEVIAPSRFGTNRSGVPVESDCHLQVRLILVSSARSHFSKRFSSVSICHCDEAPKGLEKMIFSRLRAPRHGVWNEVAHRKRVDHQAVERRITRQPFGGNDIP